MLKISIGIFLSLIASGCMQNKYADFIHQSIPEKMPIHSHYLFFMHGKIVEKKGIPATSKLYGDYQYQSMLNRFASNGFHVISETRSRGTDIYDYASKVAEQVEQLIDIGVPASNITISGFSKGGRITLVVSSLLKNKDINYVVLAGCRTSDIYKFNLKPSGRVLSLFDEDDDRFESCSEIFLEGQHNLQSKEIILNIGDGHGVFYSPITEWVEPMMKWAKPNKSFKRDAKQHAPLN